MAQTAKEYDTTSQLWFSRFTSSEEMVPDVARIRVLSALKTPENQTDQFEWGLHTFHELKRKMT